PPAGRHPLLRGGEARPDLLPAGEWLLAPRAGGALLAGGPRDHPGVPGAHPRGAEVHPPFRGAARTSGGAVGRALRLPGRGFRARDARPLWAAGGADDRRPARRLADVGGRQVPHPRGAGRGGGGALAGEPLRGRAERRGPEAPRRAGAALRARRLYGFRRLPLHLFVGAPMARRPAPAVAPPPVP